MASAYACDEACQSRILMAKSNSSRNQETAIGPIYYTQHHPHGLTVAGLRGGRGSGHIATQSDSLPRAFRANSAIRCSESGYRKNIFVVFNSATRDSHQNTSDDAATAFALGILRLMRILYRPNMLWAGRTHDWTYESGCAANVHTTESPVATNGSSYSKSP